MFWLNQNINCPPATTSVVPVMYDEVGDAKNTIALATSSGSASLPSGVASRYRSIAASSRPFRSICVSTKPGATELNLIFTGAYCRAKPLVIVTSAPFDAA